MTECCTERLVGYSTLDLCQASVSIETSRKIFTGYIPAEKN